MSTTLYRDAAITDARSDRLTLGMSLLVSDGVIIWMGPTGDEPDPGDARIVDAGGVTVVPSMVDSHSHLTLPGGSHWIDRGFDSADELTHVAEENARLMIRSGVRWCRDVGSPRRPDPNGGDRALAVQLRHGWQHRGREVPYIRAAGTWLTKTGTLPAGLAIEVEHADDLYEATIQQLDEGADLVKLYMDGPDRETAPWTTAEVTRVVGAVHKREAKATAHSTTLAGARVCAAAGVDSIEHGFELDAGVTSKMAQRGTFLISTLAVMSSWRSFAATTSIPRFVEPEKREAIETRHETGMTSVRLARDAGVPIAAGTDFGGGSLRANQLPWEVEAMVEAGLEPWEALAAATWRGGELLGEPEAGKLRVGGPADFFLVHGDPLSDPSALWRVWKVA